jgi:hypothetical protein
MFECYCCEYDEDPSYQLLTEIDRLVCDCRYIVTGRSLEGIWSANRAWQGSPLPVILSCCIAEMEDAFGPDSSSALLNNRWIRNKPVLVADSGCMRPD